MKAMVVEEVGKVSLVEREMPEVGKDEVLVKVKAAGICGSDVHIFHGKNVFATYPRVVGHEFVGEIVAVGQEVRDLPLGTHVAVDPVMSCGHCYACQHDRHNVCRSLQVMGVHKDGGYQEYVAVKAEQAYVLPADIPWDIAATVEPYSIGAQVAHRGRLAADDTVLICGAGPIGLIILQVAKMKGAKVAILDIVDKRLEKAKAMGADLTINGKRDDVVKAMDEFTAGEGASLIYEATGNVHILEQCIKQIAAPAGRVVVLGFTTENINIRQVDIMSKELEIIGTRLNNHRFAEVIQWFKEKKVDPAAIITHRYPLEELAAAFKVGEEQPEDVLKVILTFA
ncbi:MAG: zinc-binding alcohol dehydrogenase family protein [Selenomonas sp.]|uniref:zinc-binding alcohol dehydrogenase family protein n=1 Tax=Selenomonas sp. TaxID=2053611 RepID=UPI0025EB704A|nr:zinc-binding alcohol dehydrogenase family protein [Selenomonas sp.]MCR5757942.1 zinc-binding alcohol dehydrogenase family protein [Selenomonas sp.]